MYVSSRTQYNNGVHQKSCFILMKNQLQLLNNLKLLKKIYFKLYMSEQEDHFMLTIPSLNKCFKKVSVSNKAVAVRVEAIIHQKCVHIPVKHSDIDIIVKQPNINEHH